MGITIKELSKISGYSTATISRVILNKPNVKKTTRDEIEQLLEIYHYRTNVMELRQARVNSRTIMVIIGDLMNWYYSRIVEVLTELCQEQGFTLMMAYTNNDSKMETEFLDSAVKQGYAGVLFMNISPGGADAVKGALKATEIPVCFLNRGIKHAYFNTVTNDNYQGGYHATEYLISMGHKKIGHLAGGFYSEAAVERCRGFEDAMRSYGLSLTGNSIYQGNIDWESGYAFGVRTVKKGLDFSALFVSSYQMAMGLYDCFSEYGVRIPEDVSVITFDETVSMKRHGISTICSSPEKMGRTALELLLHQIEEPDTKTERIQLEPILICRESVIPYGNVKKDVRYGQ